MKLTSFGMQSAGTVWQTVVFRHSERGFEIGISRQGPGLQRNYGTGHAKVATTPIHDPAKQCLFHLQISHFSPCTTQPFHLRLATLFQCKWSFWLHHTWRKNYAIEAFILLAKDVKTAITGLGSNVTDKSVQCIGKCIG